MVETTSDLRREIEIHRDQLKEDFANLQSRVLETADWRTHYDKHPLWFLGAAFGGGFLLSGIVSPGYRSGNGHRQEFQRAETNGGQKGVLSQVVTDVKAAMISFGTAKAKEVLADVFPDFSKHLEQNKGY